ncbi:MAG: Cell envelope-related transcriptional attenuator [Candidatus Peregrinibacteria bacterium GW2011_GWA2_47_7]|nr:MAG: Cell envelope-related transcriptional attenuator [Candidatus Peregrinibacteria bacterium GW2011_GWA2_47_7]
MVKQKLLDAGLFVLMILCGTVFFHIASASSTAASKITLQELQAKSLIQELGDAKEQNDLLNKKVQDSQAALDALSKQVNAIMTPIITLALTPEQAPSPVARITAAEPTQSQAPQVSDIPQTDTFNFLIIGEHQELADSMIVAAVNANTNRINLLNIPRDLSVNGRKINEYLVKFGPDILREKVSEVIGQPIHHYAIFNMNSFENLIDALGGVNIDVPKAIYDSAYPDGNRGYMVYSVNAGFQHMTGAEALRYARSRHSTSDFDRAARQQLVVKAVQKQVLSFDFINHADQLKAFYESLKSAVDTDISVVDLATFLKNFQNFEIQGNMILSTENFFYSTYNSGGQYILLPKKKDYRPIQEFVVDVFNQ